MANVATFGKKLQLLKPIFKQTIELRLFEFFEDFERSALKEVLEQIQADRRGRSARPTASLRGSNGGEGGEGRKGGRGCSGGWRLGLLALLRTPSMAIAMTHLGLAANVFACLHVANERVTACSGRTKLARECPCAQSGDWSGPKS